MKHTVHKTASLYIDSLRNVTRLQSALASVQAELAVAISESNELRHDLEETVGPKEKGKLIKLNESRTVVVTCFGSCNVHIMVYDEGGRPIL